MSFRISNNNNICIPSRNDFLEVRHATGDIHLHSDNDTLENQIDGIIPTIDTLIFSEKTNDLYFLRPNATKHQLRKIVTTRAFEGKK